MREIKMAKRLLDAIEKDKNFLFNEIITALKAYLNKKFYSNSSYRYDEVYKLLWDYAGNMSYQDFCKAWHG